MLCIIGFRIRHRFTGGNHDIVTTAEVIKTILGMFKVEGTEHGFIGNHYLQYYSYKSM